MCSFVPRDLLVEPSLPVRRCERCALTAHAFHGSAQCDRIHWLSLEMKLVASLTHSKCVLNEGFGLRGDETNVSSLDATRAHKRKVKHSFPNNINSSAFIVTSGHSAVPSDVCPTSENGHAASASDSRLSANIGKPLGRSPWLHSSIFVIYVIEREFILGRVP